MRKNVEYYSRAHARQLPTASLTLSALTNSVYQLSDVWQLANTMSAYCVAVHEKCERTEHMLAHCRALDTQFTTLKCCDFDRKQTELRMMNPGISKLQVLDQIEAEIQGVL